MVRQSSVGFPTDEALDRELARWGVRVRIGYPFWLRPLMRSGVVAITLGRRVYLSEGLLDRGAALGAILRHELVHVRQAARLGLIGFLLAYLLDYARLRLRGLDPERAYAANRFEIEARQGEHDDSEACLS